MADKTKAFRVATSGATTDGRVIETQDIVDMVATFNAEALTPRINMEHIRGYSDQPPFCAYGDIVALEARDVELTVAGRKETRKALYATVKPTDALKAMLAKGQKIFSSIEIRPNFAGSGKAGLVGMAVTDNPASFGTEALSFASKSGMYHNRKDQVGDLFAESEEATIEIVTDTPPADNTGAFTELKGFIAGLFSSHKPEEKPKDEPKPEPKEPANDNFAQVGEALGRMAAAMEQQATTTNGALTAIRTEFATLKAKVEATPDHNHTQRPLTSGGGAPGGRIKTDC